MFYKLIAYELLKLNYMSKLLKLEFSSSFLFKVIVTSIVALSFISSLAFVSAEEMMMTEKCTITKTLKYKMKGAEVKCLQEALGVTPASGYFGPVTKKAVMAYQVANNITPAAGVFGPKTRAFWMASMTTTPGMTYPEGCGATTKYSSTTGKECVGTPGTSTTPTPEATGPVTVAVSSTTPGQETVAASILDGQAIADIASFTFSGKGVVNSISLKRMGYSNESTLSNIYLYDGMTRITDGYSFNNSGMLTINNTGTNGIFMVDGTKVITVKADVAADNPSTTAVNESASANSSTLAVVLEKFKSGATESVINLSGKYVVIVKGSLATAVLSTNSINPTGSIVVSVNPGITNYTVWSAPVQVNTRSLWLKGANFRLIGSADAGSLGNAKLYKNGVDTGKVATEVVMGGSAYLSFDFSAAPVELMVGSTTLDVRADIIKGSSRTVKVSLQQASDLVLTDGQMNVNVAVSGAISNTGAQINILKGTVTASRDSAFEVITKTVGGGSNIVIAKYKLFGYGEDVKVNNLSILPVITAMTQSGTGTTTGLQNVTLYFNGSQIGQQTAKWTSGNIPFTPGSQLVIPAGVESSLEVRADIRTVDSAVYTGGRVSANLITTTGGGEGVNSRETIDVPGLSGNVLTVQVGSLSLAKNTGYNDSQVISPNSDARIGSFSIQNLSSSESVRVTSMDLGLTVGGTAGTALTNFASVKTSENMNSPQQPLASNTINANDLILAPNATKIIDVFIRANDVPLGGTITTTLKVAAIGDKSNNPISKGPESGQTGIVFNTATLGTPTLGSSDGSKFIATGTTGADNSSKSSFKFTSTLGSSTIKEMKFVVTGGVSGTVTGLKVGTGDKIMPQTTGGLEIVSVVGLSISVLDTGTVEKDVLVSYKNVGGTGGIVSGSTSNVALAYVEYQGGTGAPKTICTAAVATAFSVVNNAGTANLCDVTLTAGTVSGNAMTLVGSKPSVSVASATSTTGKISVNATPDVIRISVTADTKGDIKLNELPVKITANPNGGTLTFKTDDAATAAVVENPIGVTIESSGETTVTATGTPAFASTQTAGGDIVIVFGTPVDISAGKTKTFVVSVPVNTYAPAGNFKPFISSSLGANSVNFKWTDTAGNATVTQGGTLIVGYDQVVKDTKNIE